MDLGTYKSDDAEIWFEDRFWGDTKKFCGDVSGVQSPKFGQSGKNVKLDPLKNCKKSTFQKSLNNFFVSPQNLYRNHISVSTDL